MHSESLPVWFDKDGPSFYIPNYIPNYTTHTKSLIMKVKFFSSRFTLSSSRNKKHARNNFTCVACHPKEDCIATGHKDGKIRLWSVYSWRAWRSFISSGLVLQNRGIPGYGGKDRTEKQQLIVEMRFCWRPPFLILLYSSLHRLTILRFPPLALGVKKSAFYL